MNDAFTRVRFSDPTIHAMLDAGRSLEETIVALAQEKKLLGHYLMELPGISPRKVVLQDGRTMIWNCPDDLVPEHHGVDLALAQSPTWPHVLVFAKRMEAKLAQNRHKGDREGWLKDDPWNLVERMLDETVEVQHCFTLGSDGRADYDNAEKLADECADVANFCMMIADVAKSQE